MNTKTAYELYEHGSGGFITFERGGECFALQIIALDKAILKGERGTLIELEFTNRSVHIAGGGLAELFDHLLGGRVKVIRIGQFNQCAVGGITLFEE